MEPIRVTMSLSEFRHAQVLHLKSNRIRVVGMVMFLVMCAYLSVMGFAGLSTDRVITFDVAAVLFPLCVPLMIFVWFRKVRQVYEQTKGFREPVDITYDDMSYCVKKPDLEAKVHFTDVVRCIEDDRILLLYMNRFQFASVPKNTDELRRFATHAVSRVKALKGLG